MISDGKLMYKESGKLLDTKGKEEEAADVKWIFVLSTSKLLYVGQKKKGRFQHSSFLAGGATLSAGRLVVEQGILKVRTISLINSLTDSFPPFLINFLYH